MCCRGPRRRWCSISLRCRRSCGHWLRPSAMQPPLPSLRWPVCAGQPRMRAAATAASGVPVGGPPGQAQRDAAARQLQQALEFALTTANLHAVNAMGGSQFAINLAAHGAQTRPSTATFRCMCCGDGRTQRCGHAFVNVLRHLASKTHWALHRRQVYDLDVDAAAWQAFVARVQGPASSV